MTLETLCDPSMRSTAPLHLVVRNRLGPGQRFAGLSVLLDGVPLWREARPAGSLFCAGDTALCVAGALTGGHDIRVGAEVRAAGGAEEASGRVWRGAADARFTLAPAGVTLAISLGPDEAGQTPAGDSAGSLVLSLQIDSPPA